jgi:hypothetical protein
MKQALRDIVLPMLRQSGFVGSLPHLRRLRGGKVDLMTFQFDKYGGGFLIEIGQCDPDGFTTPDGQLIPLEKMNVQYLRWDRRTRIKQHEGSGTDSWFRYDRGGDSYSGTATAVLPFLEKLDSFYEGLARPGSPA